MFFNMLEFYSLKNRILILIYMYIFVIQSFEEYIFVRGNQKEYNEFKEKKEYEIFNCKKIDDMGVLYYYGIYFLMDIFNLKIL